MKYISLFSGIEAASCAWEPIGWEPVAFAEIDEFPSAVLAHRWPDVPNLGDVCKVDWRKFVEDRGRPDVVVGGSPCFPAGTLVLTNERLVPIEDIKVGDLVLTHKGNFKRVLRVGGHENADTVILKGQGSTGIECTPNHPFWSIEKSHVWNNSKRGYDTFLSEPSFVAAEDMEGRMWLNVTSIPELKIPGFQIDSKRTMQLDGKSPCSCDFFYMVGRYLGDGCVFPNQYNGTAHGNSRRKTIIIVCAKDEANDLREKLSAIKFLRFSETEVGGNTIQFTCNSKQLYEWITQNFGSMSYGKHLPTWSLGMRRDFRQSLLDGYLDADGHYDGERWQSTSVCKELTLGMKMLAGSLGMTSSVSRNIPKSETQLIEGRQVYVRPTYVQRYGVENRQVHFDDSGVGFWGRVRKVLPSRSGVTVYNLEVEGDHSYTADGVAVSNCQSFSIAGGRDSLDGESRLMFEYIRACDEIRSPWIVWENVPGVLTTKDNAFQQLIDSLQDVGYVSLAWRVLDAQFFGVAQRRRRVFLVGHLGKGGRAAAVLLEPEGMCGNSKASGKKREELAADARRRTEVGGGRLTSFKWFQGSAAGTMPAYDDGTTPTLVNADGHVPAIAQDTESVAFAQNQRGEVRLIGGTGDHVATIAAQASPKGQDRSTICQTVKSDDDPKCVGFVGNYGGKTAMGVSEEVSPTVIAKHPVDVLCMAHGQANAEIEEGGVSPTLTLLHEAPIVVSESDP